MYCTQRSTVRNKATVTTGAWAKAHDDIICNSVREKELANSIRETGIEVQNFTHKELADQKKNSDLKIEERIKEVNAWKGALDVQISDIKSEMEAVMDVIKRQEELRKKCEKPDAIFNECIQHRVKKDTERIYDSPEENLYLSVDLSKIVLQKIDNTIKDTNEQLRRLKAGLYTLEYDIRDKVTALEYEDTAMKMGKHGATPYITVVTDKRWVNPIKWVEFTSINIEETSLIIEESKARRAEAEELSVQIQNELSIKICKVAEALEERIVEMRTVHERLSSKLDTTLSEISVTEKTIVDLENSIEEKKDPIRVATARLQTRSLRPNMELVKDSAHFAIEYEISVIKKAMEMLNNSLKDTNSALMRLRRAKVAIEDDLKRLSSAISIDQKCFNLVDGLKECFSC